MKDGVAEILVVDDSRVNHLAIDRLLHDENYILYPTSDGEEALDLLNDKPDVFDVVLLDLIMPRMDGMTLIRHIKSNDNLSHIPVIIQSSLSKQSEISEAIQAGAFYYLVKPITKYEIIAIVRTAVQDMVQYRRQQQALHSSTEVRELFTSATYQFKTMDEGLLLAAHLAENYAKPEQVITGIQELFLNAVEHGNLAITYDEKTVLNEKNLLQQELQRRLVLPEYKNRKVAVSFKLNSDSLELTIVDEGQGFDWQQYMEVSPERITHNHGRGIAMANLLAFDSLSMRARVIL